MRLQKDSDYIVEHKSWLLLLFPPHFGLVGWLKKGELHPKAVSTSAINMKMTRASFLLSRGNLQDSYLPTNGRVVHSVLYCTKLFYVCLPY